MSQARKELIKATLIGLLIACAILVGLAVAMPLIAGPYSIDSDEFTSTIEHGGKVDLGGLNIVDNSTLGQQKIPVTEEMIKSVGDTDTPGRKEIVIEYENREYTVYFDVKYRISYAVYGEVVDTQLVFGEEELVEPVAPKAKTGYRFAGWDYDTSAGLSGSIQINAVFVEIDYPSLDGLVATYGDTLADIELPSNEYGHWEFVSPDTTPVGDAGVQEHSVRFAYNGDDSVYKYDYAGVTVAKKLYEFTDLKDKFVYDGKEHFPTYSLPEGVTAVTTGNATTEAGEYSYSIEIIDPNYEGYCTGVFEITKPTVKVTVSSATVTYPASVPEFGYTVEGFDDVELLGIKIDAPSFASQAGEFSIGITYTNNNVNYDIQNGIFTVLKGDMEVAVPELGEVTFEDKLSDIEFVGKFLGTWAWEEPDRVVDDMAGLTAYAIFTPDNSNYNSVRMELTVTGVKKKVLSFNITNYRFTYSDGKEQTIAYELVGGKYPDLYRELTVIGNTAAVNAGEYERTLMISDSRYEGSINCRLIIDKADLNPDFSTIYERVWQEELRLESIALPDGFRWENPRERITEAGTHEYTAIYTPDDTDNYLIITSQFTVKVSKAPVVVAGVLDSYSKIYDSDIFDIAGSGIAAYYTDGTLTVTYYKDGAPVDSILNAGKYEVVITVTEGKNYLGTTITRAVTVDRATNTQTVIKEQTVKYLDGLDKLVLPDDLEGSWSWSVSDLGTVGDKTVVATYTPDSNKNYLPRTVEVKVTVEQRPVPIPEYDAVLDYNGKHQDLGLDDTTLYTVSDIGGVNVGSYEAKLTLTDPDNFTWGVAGKDYVISYSIAGVDNAWTYMPTNGITIPYKTSLASLVATAQLGGVKIEYKYATDPDSAYSETMVPTYVGDYSVRYTTLDTNCNAILTEERSFSITPITVIPTPYIVDRFIVYNGEKQFATLTDTVDGIYEITDTGATYAGETGTVTLTITDLNYVWEDGTRVLVLTYQIVKADNSWSTLPDITESIVYKENFTVTGAPKYDELVTYYRAAGSDDEFVLGLPENAGDYEIKFTTNSVNAHAPEAKYATVHIEKATVTGITFDDKQIAYSESAHYLYISGVLPEGVTVSYSSNGYTNVGEYPITATFTVSDNYYPIAPMTATLKIIKSSITGIKLEDLTVPYDGNPHSIFITGALPADVTVTYEMNGQTEPGEYEIIAKFNTTGNYEALPDLRATLKIEKLDYDMSGISFSGKTVPYDGNPHSIFITGTLPDGVSVSYEMNGQTEYGTYTITARFTGDTTYYNTIAPMTATLTVNKATVTGISFSDKTVPYDGNPHSIFITGTLPEGVSVSYANNGKTDHGTYTVTATFTVNNNYNAIEPMTATLTVNKATVTGISFAGGSFDYDGDPHSIFITGTLPEGVSVSYANNGKTDHGTYTVTATFTVNNNYNAIEPMTATLTVNKASVTFGDVSIENIFYTKAPAPSVVIDTFASSSVQYEYSVNGVTFGALSELYNESGYIPEGDYWVRAYIPATDANIASGASSAVQFTVNKATPNKVTATFGSSKKDEAGLYYQNWLVHDSTSVKVYYDDVLVDVATAEFVGITFGGSESKYNFKITPVDTDNFEITTIGVTVSIRTVATIGHGGNTPGTTSFGTIEDALDVAATKSSAEVWVLPDTSHKLYIRRSVSIASGVKLILPYGESGDDYNSGDSTETTNNISLARDDDSLCMTWVYIDSGVTLTVNGTMIISGQISAGNTHKKYVGHTYGKHARVIMLDGAQINAEGTSSKEAVLKCYGYIFDGTNASGTVTMKQYSTLYQPFVICDYRNGGYLNSVNDAKDMYNLAPFTRFQLINIESLTVYEYGSKLIGVVNINTSLGTQNAMPVIISSTMSGRGAGVLTLTSREYSSIHSKYNRATDITQLDIYGGAQTNSLVIDKTLFKISTEDGVFPLSYLYNVTLNPAQGQVGEAEFTMGQAFKMLPGAVLTVNKGAYLNITGNLSIYDEFNESVVRITDGKEKTTQSYPKGKAPALLMVYGRLEATSIGGDVYADANGAVVKVNSGTSAITHEVLVYLDDDWSSEIRSIRTVVKSFKLHYVTEYDSNGNIVSTNKVGYIEVGNTYTSNSTTKTWEPATPVVMPQYIEIVVPDGYWIETSEAISSIDYTNNDVVFTTYDSRVDGNTVRVLPGAIVTFHLTKNYLFVESGATTSYTVTADKLPKDDNTVVWLASYTVPAIYYVPVLAIDNFSTLDSCTVTYNNLQSGNVEITVVATKSVTAIVGTATAKITVSGLQNSDSTFSGKATSGTLSTGTADGKTTYSASKKGILANAAVQVTVTIYADETTLSLEGA